jgi:hypothetical protein
MAKTIRLKRKKVLVDESYWGKLYVRSGSYSGLVRLINDHENIWQKNNLDFICDRMRPDRENIDTSIYLHLNRSIQGETDNWYLYYLRFLVLVLLNR